MCYNRSDQGSQNDQHRACRLLQRLPGKGERLEPLQHFFRKKAADTALGIPLAHCQQLACEIPKRRIRVNIDT
ncbi:hypothetical protein S1361_38275 [Streptomyces cyanogenus]|uniref:Uncharacterized protein n=1 Tax=Streptomyces cyanogenus TaxID=80860 RepID=A0ABX7U6G8_STRCY|nr:hypothetical protein S1361_00225 [Streptomyces cyanogenus]QTE03246.1 hypothetical protein S1361_38275 [Streptomyces cyanogenus]